MLNFLSILLGGGILSLVQFLINRYDKKHDTNADIIRKIDDLFLKIKELDNKIKELDDKIKESSTVSARVRMLRFAGEMLRGINHTKDDWDQVLTDITLYKNYCESHPEFKNDQTVSTTEYLLAEYKRRLEKRDFLYVGGDLRD